MRSNPIAASNVSVQDDKVAKTNRPTMLVDPKVED